MAQVTLITGATSGMGRSTAFLLARKGHWVFAGARRAEAGAALAREAEADGVTIETVALDVTDTASVEAAVREVHQRAGRIDYLVNNAGYGLVSTVEQATDEEMTRQFDVNVLGVLRMCRAVLPVMRRSPLSLVRHVPLMLFLAGVPFFAVALADPLTGFAREEVSYPGRRIALLVDGSTSMVIRFESAAKRPGESTFFTAVAAAEQFIRRRMNGPYRDRSPSKLIRPNRLEKRVAGDHLRSC